MRQKFCPNCGYPLKTGQTFCSNCGYNLITHRVPKSRSRSRMARQPQSMYNQPMPPRHHNTGMMVIIALLIIIILAGGGYVAYNRITGGPSSTQQQSQQNANSNSQSNNNGNGNNNNSSNDSSTQSAPEIPQDTAMNILGKVFNDAQSKVDKNDEDNMASYFENGASNSDYKVLYNWADDQYHAESLDGLDMGVSSVSGVSSGSDGASKVACHVKYRFHYDNSVKNQTFAWYGKFKKIGGQWELVSLKPNNDPISSD